MGLQLSELCGLRSVSKSFLTQHVALPVPQFLYSVVIIQCGNKQTVRFQISRDSIFFPPSAGLEFLKLAKMLQIYSVLLLFWSSLARLQHWTICTAQIENKLFISQVRIPELFVMDTCETKLRYRSNWIIVQQGATVFRLLYFCRQLYMFRVMTPVIRSSYNLNYGFWHWSTAMNKIRCY